MSGWLFILLAVFYIAFVVQIDRVGSLANRFSRWLGGKWWQRFTTGEGGFERFNVTTALALIRLGIFWALVYVAAVLILRPTE